MKRRHKSEVARLVCDGRWKTKHLRAFRTQFGDTALFDVFFDPFDSSSDSEYTFYEQQFFGQLLLEFQPECPIPLDSVIERSLEKWNRSVEELPWYFERCFGQAAVLNTTREIAKRGGLTNEEIEKLKTFRYWLVGPIAARDA